MRYVIVYPEEDMDDREYFLAIEANSKEEVIALVKERSKNTTENNEKYYHYRLSFESSIGKIPDKPKFNNNRNCKTKEEKAQLKNLLKEHVKKCQEFHDKEELVNKEYNDYLAKCPYSYSTDNHDLPKIENIYEYPEEFWDKFLKN